MEQAPLLLVFNDLAERVAALIRTQPLLIPRLIVAPRTAVHAIAAFLHLAPDAARSDAEVATIIYETDPRNLLRAALPGCPRRLYRALDRAGDRVHGKQFYEKLGAVCGGPFADALLDGDLTDGRISYFVGLARMDPMVAMLRGALPEHTYLAEGLDCLAALLRAHGALHDSDFRLPPRAGMPAVARRLRTALARIEAPDPGFLPPPPFRIVRTTDELQKIGKRFENCVALPNWNAPQHHVSLIDGTTVFLTSDDPPLLASLQRVARNLYRLEQCVGRKNTSPPPGMRSTLIRGLTTAGLKVVAADAASALGRIEQEARRSRRAADNHEADLDDDDEDDDMDGIAA
jgi:hypothetical protein